MRAVTPVVGGRAAARGRARGQRRPVRRGHLSHERLARLGALPPLRLQPCHRVRMRARRAPQHLAITDPRLKTAEFSPRTLQIVMLISWRR